MRLVDDDGKLPAAMFVADAVEHMGKGLHRGDDELLPVLEIFRELLRLGNSRAFLDRTDDAAILREAHVGQLGVYRILIARALNIDVSNIRCLLLGTHAGLLVEC